ncbi:MAG: MmcQ/YjbR family DNA-binding protein [Bacteroidota bacterium]
MVSIDKFRNMALAFEEAEEQPHFEKASFRVNKKIFATLNVTAKTAVLKFSEIEQSVFGAYDKTIIYPVNGAWGKQGWTIVELSKVKKEVLKDALATSYCNVAPKKLSEKYKN